MKNKGAKIMAFIALLAIVASVVSTGILFIIESSKQKTETKQELSEEQLKQIQEILKSQSGAKTGTGVKILTGSLKTGTGEIK